MKPGIRSALMTNMRINETGCWIWQGSVASTGYAFLSNGSGGSIGVHRASYQAFVGPIPKGMEVDHTCHVRHCIFPGHFRLATRSQNAENRKGSNAGASSRFRGVAWAKDRGKWCASVGLRINGKYRKVYREYFDDEGQAAEAAKAKRLELQSYNLIDREVAQ